MIEYLTTERRTKYIQYENSSKSSSARNCTNYSTLKTISIKISTNNYKLFCFYIIRHLKIYLNKNYDNDNDDSFENRNSFTNETIYVKQIFNVKFKHIRFIYQLHSI